jgi:hypothetical protein
MADVPLPWDVYATPIVARKLGRLALERGEVVVRPAFFRALGGVYGAVAKAECPFGRGHDAPEPACTCGFYAVETDDELWRLGCDEPDLAVLEVELSGRVIEHEHGYRASHQRVRAIRMHRRCSRCGRAAELLHRRRFGTLVPSCARCARRPVTLDEASASIGTTLAFDDDDATPAPSSRRALLILAEILGPLLITAIAAALAVLWSPALALGLAQLGMLLWLGVRPHIMDRLGSRLGVCAVERARLRRRWSTPVVTLTFACAVAIGVVLVVISSTVASSPAR